MGIEITTLLHVTVIINVIIKNDFKQFLTCDNMTSLHAVNVNWINKKQLLTCNCIALLSFTFEYRD